MSTPSTEQDRLSRQEMWDRMYDEQRPADSWPHPDKRCSAFELERMFRRHLPAGPDVRLLEMGCGGSKWLPYFHRAFGYEVSGIDYTEVGCRLALRNLVAVGGTGTIVCRDFNELGNEFRETEDIVLSLGVVEHFAHPETVLATFAGCLREGGWLITYIPNLGGVVGSLLKRINRELYDTHHVFDLKALEEYHRIAGLEVVDSTYLEFADFTVLPIDSYPGWFQKVAKTSMYLLNRIKLSFYRSRGWNPQSRTWCAAMVVLARKPGERSPRAG